VSAKIALRLGSAWAPVLLAIAVAASLAAEGAAPAPRYAEMVLSDSQEGAAKSTFSPQTAKIFLRTKLIDVPVGSQLRSDWIAEKTGVAPPNYKIDSVVVKVVPQMNRAGFNFTKPTAGWPEGDYRVDLFIDDKPAQKVRFKVAK
jgi:hypothetical protein